MLDLARWPVGMINVILFLIVLLSKTKPVVTTMTLPVWISRSQWHHTDWKLYFSWSYYLIKFKRFIIWSGTDFVWLLNAWIKSHRFYTGVGGGGDAGFPDMTRLRILLDFFFFRLFLFVCLKQGLSIFKSRSILTSTKPVFILESLRPFVWPSIVLSVCPIMSTQYLLIHFFHQTWYGGVLLQGDVSCRKIGSLSSVSRSQWGLI